MGARTLSAPAADPVPPRAAVRIEDHSVHRLRPHALEPTDTPPRLVDYPLDPLEDRDARPCRRRAVLTLLWITTNPGCAHDRRILTEDVVRLPA